MDNDNGFGLLIPFVFYMSPQIGGLGTKAQEFLIYFHLGEVEPLPQSHLIALQVRS